ncbi:MAG: hypothetical protein JWQ38_3464 [Flavipsychrobacter sp.]|nr:hypothetical protein [Flavipsychrobacter sp.]
MKKLTIAMALLLSIGIMSCGESTPKDTPAEHGDTAVMQPNQTDSATNTISTDTTKK